MRVVYLGICWFLGLWLASVTEWSDMVWWVAGGAGTLGVLLGRRWQRSRLILACFCVVSWAGGRYMAAVPTIDDTHIAFYNESEALTLTGLVIDEPDIQDRSVNLRLDVDTITLDSGTTVPVRGKVLVRTFRFPVISYGTRLEINGRLETPPEDEDFSYKDYLARQGIHSMMNLPRLTVLEENAGHPLYHAIFALKNRAQATINRLIPDPQAALLSGILLGNDNSIPPKLAEAFRMTGMTHIIAISG